MAKLTITSWVIVWIYRWINRSSIHGVYESTMANYVIYWGYVQLRYFTNQLSFNSSKIPSDKLTLLLNMAIYSVFFHWSWWFKPLKPWFFVGFPEASRVGCAVGDLCHGRRGRPHGRRLRGGAGWGWPGGVGPAAAVAAPPGAAAGDAAAASGALVGMGILGRWWFWPDFWLWKLEWKMSWSWMIEVFFEVEVVYVLRLYWIVDSWL